jgi:hypothetical protein
MRRSRGQWLQRRECNTYVTGEVEVLCPLFVSSVVDFWFDRLYGLMAAAAGEVEKGCDEMEFRLWIVRNALLEDLEGSMWNV